jgi:hypothetical protein
MRKHVVMIAPRIRIRPRVRRLAYQKLTGDAIECHILQDSTVNEVLAKVGANRHLMPVAARPEPIRGAENAEIRVPDWSEIRCRFPPITCRFRPKSGAGLLRFLQSSFLSGTKARQRRHQ